MSKRRKHNWSVGDVFAVKQEDGRYSLGQVLDQTMTNVISCAFLDIRLAAVEEFCEAAVLPERVMSAVSTTREQLDSGDWVVVGSVPLLLPRSQWPNEEFRNDDWVGAETHGSAIVDEFLNAFHGLVPWDDWYDPGYLDTFLLSPDKKPKNLLFKKQR